MSEKVYLVQRYNPFYYGDDEGFEAIRVFDSEDGAIKFVNEAKKSFHIAYTIEEFDMNGGFSKEID